MTDSQMITLPMAILALFAATMFNNSRITDLRDSLNRRLDDHRNAIERHIDDKFALLDAKLDRIPEMLGDDETRLQRLEQQRDG